MRKIDILGLEGAVVNQDRLLYCLLFVHKSCMNRQRKALSKLGLPNPLEKCMSQLPDTKVTSQRCHMELFVEKLMKSTTLGDHNLVHSIRIAVCNETNPCTVYHMKLWITGWCYVQETSYLTVSVRFFFKSSIRIDYHHINICCRRVLGCHPHLSCPGKVLDFGVVSFKACGCG